MDLTKLLSLLETNTLFFPRADRFDDPYEGTWSKAGIELMRDPTKNGGLPPGHADVMAGLLEKTKKEIFVSCWFASDHESAAMWQLYLQSPEGVAIKSDHDRLSAAIHQSPLKGHTTMVKYIDYDVTPIPNGNLYFPFIHKRLSFEHEKELRAFFSTHPDENIATLKDEEYGFSLGVKPADLIEEILVSPTSPGWFCALVEKLAARYGLDVPVTRSTLMDAPTY